MLSVLRTDEEGWPRLGTLRTHPCHPTNRIVLQKQCWHSTSLQTIRKVPDKNSTIIDIIKLIWQRLPKLLRRIRALVPVMNVVCTHITPITAFIF